MLEKDPNQRFDINEVDNELKKIGSKGIKTKTIENRVSSLEPNKENIEQQRVYNSIYIRFSLELKFIFY
jgi:hypothetical protein